jgi:hypothetical protein
MGKEMLEVEEDTGWKKPISQARDRFQSRCLVTAVGVLLVFETVAVLRQGRFTSGEPDAGEHIFLAQIVGISVAFAGLVLVLRAATAGGALFGGIVNLLLVNGTASSQYTIIRSGLAPLALLFLLTFLATKAGRPAKTQAGLAEKRHGRNSAQVMANLSIAGLLSLGSAFSWCWVAACAVEVGTTKSGFGQR